MINEAEPPMGLNGYAAPYTKVTAFVTCGGALGGEPLVFRHPTFLVGGKANPHILNLMRRHEPSLHQAAESAY